MPTIAELIKKATGSSPGEMAQAVKTLEELYGQTPMGQQDFGPEDSTIASTVAHPIKGAGKLAEWFRGNVNTAAGYSDPFDNPNPLLGPSMDKKAEAGLNLAGMLQTGAAPFAPKSAGGTLGTFIGPKAANWDKSAAEKATKLLDAGANPAQVWKEHLIGRMPDKSLFSEIDDSLASMTDIPKGYSDAHISDVINHNELLNNYERELGSVSFIPKEYSYEPAKNKIVIGAIPQESGDPELLLHELQHNIQNVEGWAQGGNPDSLHMEHINTVRNKGRDEANRIFGRITNWDDAYQRLTGEAQARATQDRMNMSMDERRNSYPLADDKLSDIPLKNLISRYK